MLHGEHSALLSTFIKLPFSIKIFVLFIFKWIVETGITVCTFSLEFTLPLRDVQWLSGIKDISKHFIASSFKLGQLDSRWRGCGFEPHQRHCVVSLSKTFYPLLSTSSTQEDLC